jgi:6-phosphofructokinase
MNSGLGPARVHHFAVFLGIACMPGSPIEALGTAIQRCLKQVNLKNIDVYALHPGFLLRSGESQLLWNIETTESGSTALKRLQTAMEPLNIRISYESLVEEQFEYDMEKLKSDQEQTKIQAEQMRRERS